MRTLTIVAAVVLYVGYAVCVEVRLDRLVFVEVCSVRTTWISGGVQREVVTRKQENETTAEWQDRHFAAVRAAQIQHPPDTE